MAKGARASTRKRNNAALRATIFGPAHDERTARLSAKLQEVIAMAKPSDERKMDIDDTEEQEQEQLHKPTIKEKRRENDGVNEVDSSDDMEIDALSTHPSTHHHPHKSSRLIRKSKQLHKKQKIDKKIAKRKPRNVVVFPALARKGKRGGIAKANGTGNGRGEAEKKRGPGFAGRR